MRVVLLIAGTVSLLLGIMGIFLPILPTTPFLLLAAACYARSSDRAHNWLLNHHLFGPALRRWRETQTISRRAKIISLLMLNLSISFSIWLVRDNFTIQALLAITALGVSAYIYRIPTTPSIHLAAEKE